jgi:hypothetical protein
MGYQFGKIAGGNANTVLSYGCADMDEEVNRVLTTKVFPRQAEVITIDEWVRFL